MPPQPAMSKAEWEIARIVWRLGQATVREVFEHVPKERTIDYKTVQTYLRRLEAKGYLRTHRKGLRTKVYRTRARPSRVIRETVDELVQRLFDGEPLPLLHHLIEDRGLTSDQIRQLRETLNRLEAEQDESRQQ